MTTLSFLISPHVKISESELWGLVGRDELHIEKAPSTAKENTNGKLKKHYYKTIFCKSLFKGPQTNCAQSSSLARAYGKMHSLLGQGLGPITRT